MPKYRNRNPIMSLFDEAADTQHAQEQSVSLLKRALESKNLALAASNEPMPELDRPVRVIAYIRRSKHDEGNDSLPRQRRNLEQMCQRFFNRPLDACFEDEGFSGRTRHRPGYQALLAEIQKGRPTVVMVEDVDRIGRAAHIVTDFKHQCELKGIKIYSWERSGEIDTTTVAIRGAMAAEVVKMMRTRAIEGKRKRAEAGFAPNTMPFGYVKAGQKNGVWIVDETKRPIIEFMYQARLRGMENEAIARALNTREILSGSGPGCWSSGTVKNTLLNPKYAGVLIFGASWGRLNSETGEVERGENPPEQWIVKEVKAWQIVDRQTWEAVRASLQRPTKQTLKRPHDLLTSVHGVCANCGGRMATYRAAHLDRVWELRCRASHCREHKGHRVTEIEDQMLEVIRTVLSDPSYLVEFEARVEAEYGQMVAKNETTRATLSKAVRTYNAKVEALLDEKMEIRMQAKEWEADPTLGRLEDAMEDLKRVEKKYLQTKLMLRTAADQLAMLPENPPKLDPQKRDWLMQAYECIMEARSSDEPRTEMESEALTMALSSLGDLVEKITMGVVYPGNVTKFEFEIRLDAIFGEVVKQLGEDRRTITRIVYPKSLVKSSVGRHLYEVVDAFNAGLHAASDEEFATVEPAISEKVRERLDRASWSTRQFVDAIFLATRASVDFTFLKSVVDADRARRIKSAISFSMSDEDATWKRMFEILKERFPELYDTMNVTAIYALRDRNRGYQERWKRENPELDRAVKAAYRAKRRAMKLKAAA